MIRGLKEKVQSLRAVDRQVKRRATDIEEFRGIYSGRRVLLRIAEALSQNEHEATLAPEMLSRKVFFGETGAIFDVVLWPHFWGRKTAPKMGTGINPTTWGPHFWGRNLAPFLGPFFPGISNLRWPPRAPQVAAFFQWCHWLRMAVVGGEPCIVVNHLARLGLFVPLVATSMTWLLQPLDTHVFQHWKARNSSRQTTCRAETADGVMPPGRWVDIAAAAMREHVVDTDSAGHMWANGLRGPGPTLRQRISHALGTTLPLPPRPLSAQDFGDLLGRPPPRVLQTLLGAPRCFLGRKLARAAALAGGPAPVARRLGPPLRRAGSVPVAASSADASEGATAGVAEPTAPRRTRSGVMYRPACIGLAVGKAAAIHAMGVCSEHTDRGPMRSETVNSTSIQ